MLNAVLFANDEVIIAMAKFVENPNYSYFVKTASEMRKDLWGKETSIENDIIRTLAFDRLKKAAKELTENRKQKTENNQ